MIRRLGAAVAVLATVCAAAPTAAADGTAAFADARAAIDANDYAEALEVLLPLAEAGDAEAQAMIGVIHRSGMLGVVDAGAAARWFARAADQGHAEAQFRLGLMYYEHETAPGAGAPTPEALYQAAADAFRAAAEQGHAKAQLYLGYMVANGLGVDPDTGEAYMWYQLAAWQRKGLAASALDKLAAAMSPAELANARARADRFRPRLPDPKLDWAR